MHEEVTMSRLTRPLMAAIVALALTVPAAGQEEEVATTTISAIERGEAPPMVYLEGAALDEVDGVYTFSDGSGAISIGVDPSAGEDALPLFELIGIEGTLGDDGIDVSSWEPLRVIAPAVIVEEPQVIEAFRGWIIAYGSQAPEPTE
jgi:uncharacterized protein YdeI (BOF family)